MDYIMLDPYLIGEFGYDKSILVNHIYYWCSVHKDKEVKRANIDGEYWMFNSASKIMEVFPFMKESSIRRHLIDLEKEGWIESGCFNKLKLDKTKWYRFTEKYSNFLYECSGIYTSKLDNEIRNESEIKYVPEQGLNPLEKQFLANKKPVNNCKSPIVHFERPIQYTIESSSFNYNYCLTCFSYTTVIKEKINKKEKGKNQVRQNDKSSLFDENGKLKSISLSEELSKKERLAYVSREESKNYFNTARKLFPGKKKGLEVEFINFVKRYNSADWSSYNIVLDLNEIMKGVKRQIMERRVLAKHDPDHFVPQWKNFSTWINQRCWEEEDPHVEALIEELKKKKEERRRGIQEYDEIEENLKQYTYEVGFAKDNDNN